MRLESPLLSIDSYRPQQERTPHRGMFSSTPKTGSSPVPSRPVSPGPSAKGKAEKESSNYLKQMTKKAPRHNIKTVYVKSRCEIDQSECDLTVDKQFSNNAISKTCVIM